MAQQVECLNNERETIKKKLKISYKVENNKMKKITRWA